LGWKIGSTSNQTKSFNFRKFFAPNLWYVTLLESYMVRWVKGDGGISINNRLVYRLWVLLGVNSESASAVQHKIGLRVSLGCAKLHYKRD
jgi:hypothetical protein